MNVVISCIAILFLAVLVMFLRISRAIKAQRQEADQKTRMKMLSRQFRKKYQKEFYRLYSSQAEQNNPVSEQKDCVCLYAEVARTSKIPSNGYCAEYDRIISLSDNSFQIWFKPAEHFQLLFTIKTIDERSILLEHEVLGKLELRNAGLPHVAKPGDTIPVRHQAKWYPKLNCYKVYYELI